MEFNKVASVKQAIWDAKPITLRIYINLSTVTKQVKVEPMCYILHCLLPSLLTVPWNPQEVW